MSNALDILNEDLSQTDTSMPLLAEELMDLALSEIKDEPSKDGSKTNVKMTWKTTKRQKLVGKDEYIEAGFPIFDTICLTPSDKYTIDNIKRRCAAVVQALGVARLQPYDMVLNKIARCKVIVEPESRDKDGKLYPPKNVIKTYVKLGA